MPSMVISDQSTNLIQIKKFHKNIEWFEKKG